MPVVAVAVVASAGVPAIVPFMVTVDVPDAEPIVIIVLPEVAPVPMFNDFVPTVAPVAMLVVTLAVFPAMFSVVAPVAKLIVVAFAFIKSNDVDGVVKLVVIDGDVNATVPSAFTMVVAGFDVPRYCNAPALTKIIPPPVGFEVGAVAALPIKVTADPPPKLPEPEFRATFREPPNTIAF